jgi:uncharacterized protein DUF6452
MNKLRIACCTLIGIIPFFGCEKDDICVDSDTPLLVIRFYDNINPENTKNFTKLRIQGLGQTSNVDTFADRSTADSLAIPLRADSASTTYLFTLNSEGETGADTGNVDTLTFNHETKEIYVSRGCGFVANYENLSPNLTADVDNWIKSIEIVSPTIENSNTAHVKIFH